MMKPLPPDTTPIFMHLQHTGGTTLRAVIERQYKPHERYEIYSIVKKNPTRVFMEMPVEQRASYRFILGHLYYGVHRHVPGPSSYMTFMRDPVDRIISSYYYMFRKPRFSKHQLYVSGQVSWEEHLSTGWHGHVQLARIAGVDDDILRDETRIRTLADNALETAIANLEQDFSVVGIVRNYDESLIMLRYVLGWQKPIHYVRLNVGERRPRLKDLPEDDQKRILKAAEVEMPLYEHAVKLFEAQKASYPGDLEREAALLKEANQRFSARHQQIDRLKQPFRRIRRLIAR